MPQITQSKSTAKRGRESKCSEEGILVSPVLPIGPNWYSVWSYVSGPRVNNLVHHAVCTSRGSHSVRGMESNGFSLALTANAFKRFLKREFTNPPAGTCLTQH